MSAGIAARTVDLMTRSEGALRVGIELGQRPETYHDPQQGPDWGYSADFTEATRPREVLARLTISPSAKSKAQKAPRVMTEVLFAFGGRFQIRPLPFSN
jgi:hypothetical protein